MAWDKTWENVFKNRDWGKYPEIELVRFIARNYYNSPDRSKIRILDLGCGTGANSWFMAREGFNIFGVDGSKSAIDKTKKRFIDEKLKGEFIVVDFTKLPYEDNYFDCVVEVEALSCNNISSIIKTINEVHRVLKKGGKIYSQFFSTKTSTKGLLNSEENKTFINIADGPFKGLGTLHLTSPEEIKKLFVEFDDIKVEYVERSLNDMNDKIQEYLIIATK